MEHAVVVNDLQKVYDNGTEALKSISFKVEKNTIFGLIGVNGAGKTTLVRLLTTMLRPTSGKAKVWGLDPVEQPEEVRSVVGVLPQEAGLYNEFSVRENLDFIGEMQGLDKQSRTSRIDLVAKMMDIEDRLDDQADELSGGLKQRTMIARTLMGAPHILFLDELTAGLDVVVARRLRQTIKELSKEMTIFLATHNMPEAFQLCDRVAVIRHGEILEIASPQDILDQHGVEGDDFEDVIAKMLGIDEQKSIGDQLSQLTGDV